jgi:hypothetical protein
MPFFSSFSIKPCNNKTTININKSIKENQSKRGRKEEKGRENPLPSSWRFLHETLASMHETLNLQQQKNNKH